jgi:hypothetical protein
MSDLSSEKENMEEPQEKENTILNGILSKMSHYPQNSSHTNGPHQNQSHTKKKVRIAWGIKPFKRLLFQSNFTFINSSLLLSMHSFIVGIPGFSKFDKFYANLNGHLHI